MTTRVFVTTETLGVFGGCCSPQHEQMYIKHDPVLIKPDDRWAEFRLALHPQLGVMTKALMPFGLMCVFKTISKTQQLVYDGALLIAALVPEVSLDTITNLSGLSISGPGPNFVDGIYVPNTL